MQEALSDLSGTGAQRHRHFVAQVAAFHDEWRRFFTQKIVAKAQITDLSTLPGFAYAEEPTVALRARILPALLTFLLPTLALGGLAFARLRRYAVTG